MALEDILDDELARQVRITVEKHYNNELERFNYVDVSRLKTPKQAKSLRESYTLVKEVLDAYQERAGTPNNHRVLLTEEEPDEKAKGEIITFSLIRREPGSFGGGAPFENKIKNLRPMYREEKDDPENPGYRLVNVGYWHDNIVRFTCWARTNKAANARAEWLEGLLEEYAWYFKAEGIDRFLFWERQADITVDIKGNKWYGRPLDYFVRTETLRTFSEKTIEDILVRIYVSQQ